MYDSFKAFEADVKAEWLRIQGSKPGFYNLRSQDVEILDAWELYSNTRESVLKEQLLGETKMRTDVGLMQNFGTASGTKTTAERNTLVVETKTNNKTTKTHIGTNQITAKVGNDGKEDLLRRGSVLNDGWWWTFKNDAWVLGCVHGLKVMQLSKQGLAQLSDLDDMIWDTGAKRPRVLGRELVGLHAAGYKRIVHFSYKEVYVDDPKAQPQKPGVKVPKVKQKIAFEKEGTIGLLGLTFAPIERNKAMGLTFKAYYDEIEKFTKITQLRELLSSTSKHGIAYDDYEFPKEAKIVTPQQAQLQPGPTLPGSTVNPPNRSWAQIAAKTTQ